jgi:co-chaperonin GroES (HSP10)
MNDNIWIATGNNIFVKEIKEERTVGDFVLPDMVNNDIVIGEIISCSGGYWHSGTWVPMEFVNGDIVMFPRVAGAKMSFNDSDHILTHPEDIIAKKVIGIIED